MDAWSQVPVVENPPIAAAAAQPGRHKFRVRCFELADGTPVTVPVLVIRGAADGPVLYLGAAIHGDEIGGVHVAHQVVSRVNHESLTGTLVVVPVQNTLAFQQQHRLPAPLLSKSPMDQFPSDPWMSFGNSANGNSASLVAETLFGLIRQCDYAIDLHTPTTGGRYVQFAFLPPPSTQPAYERARELADAFAPDVVLGETQGVYVLSGTLHVTATEEGIPSFGVEFGEGGRYDPSGVSSTADGVMRVMTNLGMVPEAPTADKEVLHIARMTAVRTTRGGLLRTHVDLGQVVEAQQVMATIHDVYGDVVEEIQAPHSGTFMRTTTFQVVNEGERIVQVALTELPGGES